ncbi:MAG: crotonase/enoyl-CoA hydratase family protein [Pseudoxanthomonas sp.]
MFATIPSYFPGIPSSSRVSTEMRQLAEKTLWVSIRENPETGVHNFTPALVGEFASLIDALGQDPAAFGAEAGMPAYAVIRSQHPGYFSQGGDLRFFHECIRNGDSGHLREYSLQCLDVLHAWATRFKATTNTISLVQGRALGGGFELALSSDYLIAEEQSTFGFPEIMFGLFPCTGAMGLLSARTTARNAEKMMTNKRIYTAAELYDMGIVDEVCERGMGELAVERYIANHAKRLKSRLKVQESRYRQCPFDRQEGVRIVEDWVETAMRLDADEMRSLEMLILMQDRETPAMERRLAA